MGLDAKGFAAKPVAGAAKAGDDLISNQEDAIFVDDALNFGPIGRRGNDHPARTLHRLADKGRDVFNAQLQDHRFQLAGAQQAKVFGRHIAALLPPVGLADMHDARDLAAMGMDARHATQRPAAHG